MNIEEIASRLETYLFWELAERGMFARVECRTWNATFYDYRIDVTLIDIHDRLSILHFPVRVDAFALWTPAIDPFNTIKQLAGIIAADKAKLFLG